MTELDHINAPLVTIAIPVFNGENFLREAIESTINQEYRNLEIILSDNASTDSTLKICREYGKKDPRIRIIHHDENVGASENHNNAFRISKGKYFKWLSHDDVMERTCISRSVEVMENMPDVGCVYFLSNAVTEEGEVLEDYSPGIDLMDERPSRRLYRSTCISHPLMEVFGVFRSDVLKKTRLFGKYSSSDRIILAEVALLAPSYRIEEYLFNYRIHPNQSCSVYNTRQVRGEWFDPKLKNRRTYPHWRLLAEMFKAVRMVKLRPGEKIKSYFTVLVWSRRRAGYLLRNLFHRDRTWKKEEPFVFPENSSD